MLRLRSILYTPGHRPDRIAKAVAAGADATAFVLEDSVPRDLRSDARRSVAAALAEHGATRRPLFVKVNALGPGGAEGESAGKGRTEGGGGGAADPDAGELAADLAAIVRPGLAGIIVPKIAREAEVRAVDRLVTAAEDRAGMARGTVEILLLVETPRAVATGLQLIEASERVTSVICGAAAGGDLAGALGLEATADGSERAYVLAKVLVDARAAGIETPLDGVWTGIGDLGGLEREARRARALGYRGKLAVHPEQIATIHRVFSPSATEIDRSLRILEAFEAALQRGDAAIVVDGRMIDYAMAGTARRVLELAADLEEADR
jgi:citrate lyase subunit beta/citryl-CoA lyase